MAGGAAAALLDWILTSAQLELDCTSPAAARDLVGRMMLSEIEGAEDIHREAMWQAFGRCPPGAAREPCVARAKQRFEADWDRQKAAIEARYQKVLEDLAAKCRASPA